MEINWIFQTFNHFKTYNKIILNNFIYKINYINIY